MLLTAVILGITGSLTGDIAVAKPSLQIPKGDYTDVPKPDVENKSTLELLEEGVYGGDSGLGILQIFKYIIGAVAVLMIVISGLRMVIAQGDEEAVTKSKSTLTIAIIGLVMISMSTEIGKVLEFNEKGGPLGDPNKTLARVVNFDKSVKIVITFIKYIMGSVAVLMAVKSGVVMVTKGSDEEAMTKEKKQLGISAAGLILIVMADTLIKKVFYKIDTTTYPGVEGVKPGLDPYAGVKEIVGITNFVVSFISPIAVLVFMIGGVMYLTAGDDEEKTTKARRMMIAAGIGIVVIYGAFALVSTFITGQIDAVTPTT